MTLLLDVKPLVSSSLSNGVKKKREEKVLYLNDRSNDELIWLSGNYLRLGFRVAIDCGKKGNTLGGYYLTHTQERFLADSFLIKLEHSNISAQVGRKIKIFEEFRGPIFRKRIFVVLEPKI